MVELLTDAGAGEEAESLLKFADIAMYYAKRVGNQVCFYRDFKDDL
jgi:GGDEF domain-containing protein